jgi:hypothetical protein
MNVERTQSARLVSTHSFSSRFSAASTNVFASCVGAGVAAGACAPISVAIRTPAIMTSPAARRGIGFPIWTSRCGGFRAQREGNLQQRGAPAP